MTDDKRGGAIRFTKVKKFLPQIRKITTSIYCKIGVTIFLIILIFHYISIREVIEVFSKVRYSYILPIIPLLLVLYVLLSLSTWVLLWPIKRIHFGKVFKYQMYSSAIATFTPAQLGESYIAILLRKEGVNLQKGLSLFVFNKVINILIIIFVAVPMVEFLKIDYSVFYLLLFIFFILFPVVVVKTRLRIMIREAIVKKYFAAFYEFFELISDYIKSHVLILIINILINVLKISVATLLTWLSFLAVGVEIQFFMFFAVWNFARLAGLIPFSLSAWGFLQGTAILVLTKIGYETPQIVGGAMIERFFALSSSLIILSFCIWQK